MQAHGHISHKWHRNVLNLKVHGPFNIKGVEKAFADIRKTVNLHNLDCWYRIEVLDPNTLGCPDVMKVIGKSYHWSFENGCPFIAVVCANALQHRILQEFIRKSKHNMKAFFDEQEALEHITQLSTSES